MKNYKTFNVQYRRKREGRTNYKIRFKMLQSGKPRLVVRSFSKNIIAQIIGYNEMGDKVIASAYSKELEKLGWKANRGNLPTAYLVGFLIGKKAVKQGVEEAIFDIGGIVSKKGNRLYALLKGAVDGGLNINHSDEIFPSEERIRGKHISDYAAVLKKDEAKYKATFSDYLKKGADPMTIGKDFDMIKKKLEELK